MVREIATRLASDHTYKGKVVDHICDDLNIKSDFELHCMCQDFAVSTRRKFSLPIFFSVLNDHRDSLLQSLHSLNYTLEDELFLQSGKFNKLIPMLHSLKEENHRVLIFSQCIQMLDILEEFCRIKEYSFLRFDGSTLTSER